MKMKKILIFALIGMMLMGIAGATYTTLTPSAPTENAAARFSPPATMWATLLGNGSICNFLMEGGYQYLVMVNVTGVIAGNPTLKYVNIMAGDNPPALRSSIGNLSLTSETAGVYRFGPLESARFKNSTGYCQIGSKNLTGTIAVLKIPAYT
jgi:hypothetical protein